MGTYKGLEMIVVYNGAKSAFTPSDYKNKLVLVTGNPASTTIDERDPYIYAIDSAGNYKSFRLPNTFVRGIKVANDANYQEGLFNFAASNGITVSRNSGTITFNGATLQTGIANAAKAASDAATTANAALAKANANEQAISELVGIDGGGSIGDIANRAVDVLRKEVYGNTGEVTETIPELRGDIDRIDEAYPISLTKRGDVYVITQGNKSIGTIDLPNAMVIESGSIVNGYWVDGTFTEDENGTDKAIKLSLQGQDNALYIDVADLIDAYTAQPNATQVQIVISNSNELSATIVAGGVGTTELAGGAVTTAKIAEGNVTKEKLHAEVQTSLELADSSIQSIISNDPTTIEVETKKANNIRTATIKPKTNTIGNALLADGNVEGLATVADVYAYINARLSVKIEA